MLSSPQNRHATWHEASRRLFAKMLAEFAYEGVISPKPDGTDPFTYRLPMAGGVTYRFRARRGAYGHWRVDPASVTPSADPLEFVALAHETLLGLTGDTTGRLLRELTATLVADTRLDATAVSVTDLAKLDYAELEGHQTGHPWMVAGKGRLGFSAHDADRFAPEARTPLRLPWLAVHRDLARYRGVPALGASERLYAEELTPTTRAAFERAVADQDRDPAGYLWLPVHPWQWDENVAPLFAPQLADGGIIPLPADEDLRLPQQSVHTFLNTSRPRGRTVALPLSVLGARGWCGLPGERALAAPLVTGWVHALRDTDPFLRDETRVILLGETASITVEHPLYDRLPNIPSPYRGLLGCVWGEPLVPCLGTGDRARNLAALLLTDAKGHSFTAELVHRSGLAPIAWLRRLLATLLPPLLHFLYRYGVVIPPHGENAIVVFDEQEMPVRLAMKGFAGDVTVSAQALPEHDAMPAEVRTVLPAEPPAFLTRLLHSGLFAGFFRYLAPLCEEHLGVPENAFWSLVRAEILCHQARFPGLEGRFETFDLLTPRIERLRPNHDRLHPGGDREHPAPPRTAVHETVLNPLHYRYHPPVPLSVLSVRGEPVVGAAT